MSLSEVSIEGQVPPATAPVVAKAYRSGVLRAVFSFPVMLATLLVLFSVTMVRSRLSDPDMWWHLKTGEIIWNTHAIPQADVFSFTTNHHVYTPHEWLAQVTIYAAYRWAGYSGIMLWLCFFTSLVTIGGYTLCWLYSGNGKIAFLGAWGMCFFSTIGLAARPQLIGYFFLVCELIIILLGLRRNVKWFYALPALFAVWVNCHGSFLLGLIASGVALFCGLFEFQVGLVACHRWSRQESRMLTIALTLSVAALFLNPVGLTQITYPINTMFGQHIGLQYSSEWQPPSLYDVRTWAVFATGAMVLILPALLRAELRVEELVLLGMGFVLAIQHERMFFVFGILVMPSLCRLLASLWVGYEPSRDFLLPNMMMILSATTIAVLLFPSSRDLTEQVNKANPVQAVRFIQRSGLSGRMLNEYLYGGYLIWEAPDHKVFVDGRSDIYEWSGVLADYMNLMTLTSDPGKVLTKYKIDFCLLSRDQPMTRVLPLIAGWQTIYADDMSVVIARATR